MTASAIIALIGGIATAACAIAGAIAGIRARRAREAQEQRVRDAEYQAKLDRLAELRRMRFAQQTPATTQAPVQQVPTNGEIHCYHHNVGTTQVTQTPYVPAQTSYPPQTTYGQVQQSYYQNPYMNSAYQGYNGYGAAYNDAVYPTERLIGEISKRNMYMRQCGTYQPTSYNTYYPQSVPYAYAS